MPSVQLLLDRARAAGAPLRLDADTLPDVVRIVRRLDGLPLAIELAAARLRVLSLAEVADRLTDRFRLLTGGKRTAVPRHRTLRAVVEWSWDLMDPLEREVAEHFSLFGSGATAQAVRAVSPTWRGGEPRPIDLRPDRSDGPELTDVQDVLHALVDKSILVAEPDELGTRFRMLETLREYGSEQLSLHDQMDPARLAHARFYARLAQVADARLRTRDQLAALHVFDVERDNVLAALAYLGDSGDAGRVGGPGRPAGLALDAARERPGRRPLAAVRHGGPRRGVDDDVPGGRGDGGHHRVRQRRRPARPTRRPAPPGHHRERVGRPGVRAPDRTPAAPAAAVHRRRARGLHGGHGGDPGVPGRRGCARRCAGCGSRSGRTRASWR